MFDLSAQGELMNADMSVEYSLNRIINAITEQGEIRQKELTRYPLCLLYGNFPDMLSQMIRMELISKVGNEEAVEVFAVHSADDVNEGLDHVIGHFRQKMDNGLKRLACYYISIIFMADQLDAEEMKKMLSKLVGKMKRMGFDADSNEKFYYCIFDYEFMNGRKCREQILRLRDDAEYNFPMCIFTKDHLAGTEDQKYLKDVQAMAMHIFLKVLDKPSPKSRQKPRQYVIGYWKLDVLKQKAADYLLDAVERQDRDLLGADYAEQIRGIIDGIVFFDTEYWVGLFCRMPIDYTAIRELMKPCPFKRNVRTYREIIEMLYGGRDAEAFHTFVSMNHGDSIEEHHIKSFFASDIGNLYAVVHRLREALLVIKKQYEDEKLQVEGKGYEERFRFVKKYTITDILSKLKENFWDSEAEMISIERRINFVCRLMECMDSEWFEEKVRMLKERNQSGKKRLALIRREVSMDEDFVLKTADIPVSMPGRIPKWDEDLFCDASIKAFTSDMEKVKVQVQDWMAHHADEVLLGFAASLQVMKMNHQSDIYYSARIDIPRDSKEKEYLYAGIEQQDNTEFVKRLQEIVNQKLPKAKVFVRKWETDMCFELYAIKEIEDLQEIYNMDE